MKKFAKGFGLALMILGVFGAYLTIRLTPTILSKEFTIYSIAGILIWLAAFAGLFLWGSRMRNKATASGQEGASTPPKSAPIQEPAAPAVSEKPPLQPETAKAPEARPEPGEMTRDGLLCLYRNEDAQKEAMYWYKEVVGEVDLLIREGTPLLSITIHEGVEFGVGRERLDSREEVHELPKELRIHPTAQQVANWVDGILANRCSVPWADEKLQSSLAKWDDMVRRYALITQSDTLFPLPDCLYPVKNPFAFLDGIGPHGLTDKSGVRQWLRMKKDASISDVIRALPQWNPRYGTAVLVDKDWAGYLPSLSMKDRLLCSRKELWIGVVTGEDRIANLVNGQEYQVRYEQWPGPPLDGTTFACWWLEKLPSCQEDRLFEISRQILSDCAVLGVPEWESQALLADGLCTDVRGDGTYLGYDKDTGEYTVDHWERGTPTNVITERDSKEFRCVFLQHFVYHVTFISKDMQDPEAAIRMLQKMDSRFSDTKAYQKALRQYEEAFGPLPAPKLPEDDFNGGKAYLCDFITEDQFFAELMSHFTPLKPLAYFSDEWADRQDTGRFVILVNERHSVYLNGRCIFENPNFTGTPDACYRKNVPAYRLYSWFGPTAPEPWVNAKKADLPLEEAVKTAKDLSSSLHTQIAVVRVVKDYDRW